ncbi:hypothetical protein HPB50_026617 [Hyalomma asiaticum]|uniref:Uncharacterized protein n=1 Tax=Hyalomma asiaticum TaxID=266040 RepID=A0ACB7TRH3_HYAAI|nr:hypothetical protein HPB50_026617 [Hyalomma asiaticum]
MTLRQISDDILNNYNQQVDHDPQLKKMLDERYQLPVYNSYDSILDAIHQSSVVIIRGATGCGKTTQVSTIKAMKCEKQCYKETRMFTNEINFQWLIWEPHSYLLTQPIMSDTTLSVDCMDVPISDNSSITFQTTCNNAARPVPVKIPKRGLNQTALRDCYIPARPHTP